jgi:predicted nucleotidyltransferase
MTADHGLSDRQLALIKNILLIFRESITSVGLFGSRATGKYRPSSDIDLVIYGDLDSENRGEIFTLFNNSSLPVTVDVVVYKDITNPKLKSHIDNVMLPLFDFSKS